MNVLAKTISTLRLGLPKGSMQSGVLDVLADAGIRTRTTSRSYRPAVGLDRVDAKLLKPQSIIEMLALGSRDVGFAGADWVAELDANVIEVLDTGLDPVRLVAAAPDAFLVDDALPRRPLIVASEYANLTNQWIVKQGLDARLLRSYGATEVLPPEDADCIVDNTATGATLVANGLTIVDELMSSSTRMYASPQAMADTGRRQRIEDLALLLGAVLDARRRVIVEVNVTTPRLEAVLKAVPCMREPTVSPLSGDGFAVKVAVKRSELARLIPVVRAAGGTDILVSQPQLIVPGGASCP